MKDVLKTFGGTKDKKNKKATADRLNEAHFSAFVASLPELEARLSEDDVKVLFYKIDQHQKGFLQLDDLVQFSLLDKSQM